MREMLEIYIGFWRSCSSSPFAIYPCSFGKHAGPKVEIFRERSWAYITFLFWSFVGTLRKVIENRYYLCECLTLSVSVGSGGEEGNAAQNNGRGGRGDGDGDVNGLESGVRPGPLRHAWCDCCYAAAAELMQVH